ncbi:hypothetical protein SELMODRAFT_412571 [Selaginella moellendorffii]|uniref:Uncharacterized protein n=1 Tax=Selaginella moellendorffii TaxID=88036 RepID=D8RLX1_SELML|nr:hypothetical protein SELMODRAFT_412571 [Selaginella moellendorffii]
MAFQDVRGWMVILCRISFAGLLGSKRRQENLLTQAHYRDADWKVEKTIKQFKHFKGIHRPTSYCQHQKKRAGLSVTYATWVWAVSQSGLVLVREGRGFWVGNPFFNKWKAHGLELPYAKFDPEIATLVDHEQGYRVVFRVRRFVQTAVLCSWKSEWLLCNHLEEDLKKDFVEFVTSSSTVCDNIIHSIGSKSKVALLSYCADNGEVLSLRYLKLGSEVLEGCFKLFGRDGKLYLLGKNGTHLFGLFEIRGENVVLISRAPKSISARFPFIKSASIDNNIIYCISHVKQAMLVTYNLSQQGSWQMVPLPEPLPSCIGILNIVKFSLDLPFGLDLCSAF